MGPGRQPKTQAQRSSMEPLEATLQCILADFGVARPPAGGCAARTGGERDDVAQIVHEVLDVLARKGLL
jgi:hypothetical protein